MATKTEAADAENPEDDVEMGFFEHLKELRKRLVLACWGLVPGVILGALFYEEILAGLLDPFFDAWYDAKAGGAFPHQEQPEILSLSPFDTIVVYFKNAIVLGLVIGAPWVFWQAWAFISPGLYRREKRLALPFASFSGVFFLSGVAFGYLVVFPIIFAYFLGFSGDLADSGGVLKATYHISEITSMELKLLLAFGVVFDLPVVISFLAAIGLVDWKQLLKFTPWWALIAAVLSALLTPPDPGSQLMMLAPLMVLYMVSIGFAAVFGRKRDELEPLDE